MTKYVAKADVSPKIKKGDIVEFNDPLIPEYQNLFEKYDGQTEEAEKQTAGDNDDPVKTGIINPDRNALKAKATELGINFADNIPTVRLSELIQEAEAKRQDSQGEGDSNESDDDNEE